jgi:hypothetical protein
METRAVGIPELLAMAEVDKALGWRYPRVAPPPEIVAGMRREECLDLFLDLPPA